MRADQIAAITYTIRDEMKTEQQVPKALKRLHGIGFGAVELFGLDLMPIVEWRRLLDAEGLVCCSAHIDMTKILERPNEAAEDILRLGARYCVYSYPAGIDLRTEDEVWSFASRLEAAGSAMAALGVTLCYHNHHIEFRQVGGATILEHIYSHNAPEAFAAELDTHWVQRGGGDPAMWCQWLTGRLPLLHMKDYVVNKADEPDFAEVGSGNLNWKSILPAAEAAGCEWFIVEQDTTPGDPFDSLTRSYTWLTENAVS